MARGHRSRGGVHVSTEHRFRADAIDTTWRLRCDGGCGRKTMTVHFPTWGPTAALRVVRRDGSVVRLDGRAPMSARDVDHSGSGAGRAAGTSCGSAAIPASAVLASVATRRQSWNPRSGPTLAVRLPRGERVLGVSIVPEGGPVG